MTSKGTFTRHGHFLGNGGQAIAVNNQLFTRDLFEHGLHLAPYLKTVDASSAAPAEILKIAERAHEIRFPAGLSLPHSVLAQKIHELNEWSRNLGECLLQALICYSWESVSFELPLTDESAPGAPECKWEQVANRLRDSIYIQEALWNRLSPVARTVLLIHEAVYSLLKPQRLAPHCYRQYGPQARRLTAAFFDSRTFLNPARRQAVLQEIQKMNIPLTSLLHDVTRSVPRPDFFAYPTAHGFEQLALRVPRTN